MTPRTKRLRSSFSTGGSIGTSASMNSCIGGSCSQIRRATTSKDGSKIASHARRFVEKHTSQGDERSQRRLLQQHNAVAVCALLVIRDSPAVGRLCELLRVYEDQAGFKAGPCRRGQHEFFEFQLAAADLSDFKRDKPFGTQN